ncbi:hypothetical protein ML462_14785 [Gramella lutea]|uniref:Uncharacterized protein n=1 Tax=Christiangramia lutea TaxID=1607951 RepID=A0A9X1V683_9FLAO|nr:hypothetical protein [Christiangramia lutea]MCH4824436.1 hypothetical protein [Christiangramia lutea]
MSLRLLQIFMACMLFLACEDQKNKAQKNPEIRTNVSLFDLPDSLSGRRISFVLDLKRQVA